MEVALTVSGAEAIEKQLLAMERKVAKKIVRKAVRDGGKVTLKVAQDLSRNIVGGQTGGVMAKALRVRAYKRQKPGTYAVRLAFDTDKYPLTQPVAWTKTYNGARVFFTTLGHPKDYEEYSMRRLLMNGIYWALGQEVPQGGALAEPKGKLAGWEAPDTH